MTMRNLPIGGGSMLFGLAILLVTAATPAAAQGTPQQQQACQGDAMRLCSAYIPDAGRVRGCMVQHINQLSAECRAQFKGGGRASSRSSARRRHRRSRH